MNFALKLFTIISILFFSSFLNASEKSEDGLKQLLEKPLIERYILDELKDLRIENMKLRVEVEKK